MNCQFKLLKERKKTLPGYRWLSIWPFNISCSEGSINNSTVFEELVESEAFNRPYIFNGPTHGPFPPGELKGTDYERISSEDAKQNIKMALVNQASWMDAPNPPDAETLLEIDTWLDEIPDALTSYRLLIDSYTDQERLHEVGWVLWEFNEHVVIDISNGRGWFIVIGMD